ncbi:MAG: hypothetical protein V2I56_14835 [Desulfobacteraceae bacterium]|jgi:hypothetical protein|nr:hypothetical protein [Desulfobacteraceae bacterium]
MKIVIDTLAKREWISINQFIASATAEKMTALLTEVNVVPCFHLLGKKSGLPFDLTETLSIGSVQMWRNKGGQLSDYAQ